MITPSLSIREIEKLLDVIHRYVPAQEQPHGLLDYLASMAWHEQENITFNEPVAFLSKFPVSWIPKQ